MAKSELGSRAIELLLKAIAKHRPRLEAAFDDRGSMSLLPRSHRRSIRAILDAAARVGKVRRE